MSWKEWDEIFRAVLGVDTYYILREIIIALYICGGLKAGGVNELEGKDETINIPHGYGDSEKTL